VTKPIRIGLYVGMLELRGGICSLRILGRN
jgi:hypothetical protein